MYVWRPSRLWATKRLRPSIAGLALPKPPPCLGALLRCVGSQLRVSIIALARGEGGSARSHFSVRFVKPNAIRANAHIHLSPPVTFFFVPPPKHKNGCHLCFLHLWQKVHFDNDGSALFLQKRIMNTGVSFQFLKLDYTKCPQVRGRHKSKCELKALTFALKTSRFLCLLASLCWELIEKKKWINAFVTFPLEIIISAKKRDLNTPPQGQKKKNMRRGECARFVRGQLWYS